MYIWKHLTKYIEKLNFLILSQDLVKIFQIVVVPQNEKYFISFKDTQMYINTLMYANNSTTNK